MEPDFHERVGNLASDFFVYNTLAGMPIEVLIETLKQLAVKHQIDIEERDLGEQEKPEWDRSWKRYQLWFNDPESFQRGVYGQSDESIEQAYGTIPNKLSYVVGVRESN